MNPSYKLPDIIVNPEPGMLVNIPLYKEFEHKVTYVSSGVRHFLYGLCWDKIENVIVSTNDDC